MAKILGLSPEELQKEIARSDAKRIIEKRREENQSRQEQSSKKRLIGSVERKFKTTMIGALASFEERFGSAWGHGKETADLTAEESENRGIWNDVRTDILNKGNNQLRAAQEEIAQYTMTWDKYRTEFLVNKESNNE